MSDLPPWEQEELERWGGPNAGKQAEPEEITLPITTRYSLMDSDAETLGLVSAYEYYVNDNLKEDMSQLAEMIQRRLLKSIMKQAHELGGDAIVGLSVQKNAAPASYTTATANGYLVQCWHCLNVSVYGTAIKRKKKIGAPPPRPTA